MDEPYAQCVDVCVCAYVYADPYVHLQTYCQYCKDVGVKCVHDG